MTRSLTIAMTVLAATLGASRPANEARAEAVGPRVREIATGRFVTWPWRCTTPPRR